MRVEPMAASEERVEAVHAAGCGGAPLASRGHGSLPDQSMTSLIAQRRYATTFCDRQFVSETDTHLTCSPSPLRRRRRPTSTKAAPHEWDTASAGSRCFGTSLDL